MSEKFKISPRRGKSTVSLVTRPYLRETKRTTNHYEGSFSLDLDPDLLDVVPGLKPGEAITGLRLAATASIELDALDIARIRQWLTVEGTHVRRVEAARVQERQRAETDLAARQALTIAIEADVRRRVEQERIQGPSSPEGKDWCGDVLRAEAAVRTAAESLVLAAALAREEGHQLSSLRSTNTNPELAGNKLEVLQAHATRLRTAGLTLFEDACKAAKLMTSRR
jgi:hypothetical protein